ncbi:HigA family addiction module antitoxin [Dolichospermum planctonicum]|uniref:HigA family addiction module antitoxin n=1 Tax=Dolichospermum planctonicum TaxID=136072 RepID=UPI002FEE604E
MFRWCICHAAKYLQQRFAIALHLEPLNMTVTELANILGVSRKTVSEIVNERASVTPNIALRLASAFQTTPELWLNLQQKFDLWCAKNESEEWKNISPIEIS